ncbi:MAG: hypothetical protein ACPGIJ_08970 [Mycobacterium sp.]
MEVSASSLSLSLPALSVEGRIDRAEVSLSALSAVALSVEERSGRVEVPPSSLSAAAMPGFATAAMPMANIATPIIFLRDEDPTVLPSSFGRSRGQSNSQSFLWPHLWTKLFGTLSAEPSLGMLAPWGPRADGRGCLAMIAVLDAESCWWMPRLN